jgi:hypothetical protein
MLASKKARFPRGFRGSGSFSKTFIGVFSVVFSSSSARESRFRRELRGFLAGTFSRVFFPIHRVSRAKRRFLDRLGKGSLFFPVSSTRPIMAVSKRSRFHGVIRKTVIYSNGYIGVFSEVFLGSENALRSEVSFSRRNLSFLSRLFAVGLFLMIISSQGI